MAEAVTRLDPSIYDQVDTTTADPFATAKSVLGLQGVKTQNDLLRLQLEGRQRLGKAVQDAIDPNTGEIDSNKLLETLRSPENYPAAAEGAGLGLDLRQKGLVNTGQTITNQKSAQDLANDSFSTLGTAWGARLARTTGPVSANDLRNDILDLVAQGRMLPSVGRAVMQNMPDDPNELRSYAAGGFLQALGAGTLATPANASPSPSGAPRQQTMGQAAAQSMGAISPEAPPSASGVPSSPSPGGEATTVAPIIPYKPPTAPGFETGLAPGAAEARQSVGKSAGDAAVRLSELGVEVPTRKGMLDNMLADQTEFTSGPPSDELKNFVASINTLFGTNFDVERVAAQERFDKLANQIALQQSGALGVTDLTTTTAMGANPNSRMSNLGIQGVIALLKGNEDAIAVKFEKWQDYQDEGGKPEDYYKWSRDFNKHYDPRVFQSVYLTEADKRKMISQLTPREYDIFKQKYNYAVEHGWIPDPRVQ